MGAVMAASSAARPPLAREPAARAGILEFLAEPWLHPVEPRQTPGLRALGALSPAEAVGLDFDPTALESARTTFDLHLRVPGGRAFLPYETSHLPAGATPTGPTRLAQIAGIYATAGYELEPFTQFPADHLGHELRFLAALARREATATGDAAAHLVAWQAGFARDHAVIWLAPLVAHVERVTTTPLFPALARIARLVVGEIAELESG